MESLKDASKTYERLLLLIERVLGSWQGYRTMFYAWLGTQLVLGNTGWEYSSCLKHPVILVRGCETTCGFREITGWGQEQRNPWQHWLVPHRAPSGVLRQLSIILARAKRLSGAVALWKQLPGTGSGMDCQINKTVDFFFYTKISVRMLFPSWSCVKPIACFESLILPK